MYNSNDTLDNSSSGSSRELVDQTNASTTTMIKTKQKMKKSTSANGKLDKTKLQRLQNEREKAEVWQEHDAKYDQIRRGSPFVPSIWAFESLFPEPVVDADMVEKDLDEVSNICRKKRKDKLDGIRKNREDLIVHKQKQKELSDQAWMNKQEWRRSLYENKLRHNTTALSTNTADPSALDDANNYKVDWALSRKVEDSVYGIRREGDMSNSFVYDLQEVREGARLGKTLKVNLDRLNYFAKKELAKTHLAEATELYSKALELDRYDGRAYLGLSRVAQKKRDFGRARKFLKSGVSNCPGNPFLLTSLGNLEERVGNLVEAERAYVSCNKACPSHAAGWVSLAQLRTRKLRRGPKAGRDCYQTAEYELRRAGLPQSSHVYTAWASLEYDVCKDYKTAKDLYEKALVCDPKCSVALLKLGVMEADQENWDDAKNCFEQVLTYDMRNSRVLQAYAIMESKRPDGSSRRVIDLFEKALDANPRDAGVYQAYGLYVAELGEVEAARKMFRKGTKMNKKHAPLWQAWGVLETLHGSVEDAREVFQQGIWACAQSSGGQSGGRRCARLWQAWGVLENKAGNFAEARRCFGRTLDADRNNPAAVTAWALMEAGAGNWSGAREIYERALIQLPNSSSDKATLWMGYESMEKRGGNLKEAQLIFQRALRDSILSEKNEKKSIDKVLDIEESSGYVKKDQKISSKIKRENKKQVSDQHELVAQWKNKKSINFYSEQDVWMNNGSIEGRMPTKKHVKKKRKGDAKR